MQPRFRDRRDAGARLGRSLSTYAGREDVVVLGLPRGGVPVAYEIALALRAPIDVIVVRKLGVPGYEELGMGAIASGGIQVVDRHITKELGVTAAQLRIVVERESRELARREQALRGKQKPLDVAGKTVIAVDDGLATGSTMLAAVTAMRVRGPAKLVVAVPVGAPDACNAMRAHVDDMHCLLAPDEMEAVGNWYDDFTQTTDDEVRWLVERANRPFVYRGEHGVRPSSDHRHGDPAARRSH